MIMMIENNIRHIPEIRLSGRFDAAQEGFPMMWSGANAEMLARASILEIEILCDYTTYRPYLSFEVDGLKSQTFSPLKGTHFYTVFLNMDKGKAHNVRVTLETQAFAADPASYVEIRRVRTDGEFLPLPAKKLRLEFIGDSITSGEGMRGPHDFNEWVPMMFSSTDNYTRWTADKLNAQYQVVSQSGWGFFCSWDNNPRRNIPDIYPYICYPCMIDAACVPVCGGEKPYDFSFDPDAVIVNLGSNDMNAVHHPSRVDPVTGEEFKLRETDGSILEDAAYRFIRMIHEKNPRALIVWAFGVAGTGIAEAPLRAAVSRARKDGIRADYLPLPDCGRIRRGIGSRFHPGPGAHKRMAEIIAKHLKKTL